ncbi:MAG: LamG domain-containing protein [Candidatus Poribacteria bacterium]|nr:LamG domain-containing protein [Candidatus Poribacteria bacterium]
MKLTTYLFATLLFFVGLLTVQAAVKDDGLILYFSFDNENGGKIEDKTGGGNDAEIINKAEITTGEKKFGKGALEIRDANADVQVQSFKELVDYQDNSYLFWINFIEAHNGAWSQIIAKKAPGSDRSPGIWICPNSLNIHWRFNPGNQGTGCAGPDGENTLFETKKWYHVAGIKEDGTLTFYVDGEKLQEYPVPAKHAQGAEQLYIGKTGYRAATFYIDELYVYDRALDEKEIASVMEGDLLPVEPQEKLTTTWGKMKTRRD